MLHQVISENKYGRDLKCQFSRVTGITGTTQSQSNGFEIRKILWLPQWELGAMLPAPAATLGFLPEKETPVDLVKFLGMRWLER